MFRPLISPTLVLAQTLALLGLVGACGGNVANAQWILVGDASQADAVGSPDCVNITEDELNEASAAWNECALDLEQDFSFSFDVNLGADPGGADGMCFVLHQAGTGPLTVGGNGGDIAYVGGPFNPSVCIEIDTYQNGPNDPPFDPAYDHIGIDSNGQNVHALAGPVQANVTNGNIEDGADHSFEVTWDAENTLLEVYFDGAFRLDLTLDMVNDIFGGNAEVQWGWVSSTGGATNAQSFCMTSADYSAAAPELTLLVDPEQFICGDGSVELSAEAAPGADISWNGVPGASTTASVTGTYVVESLFAGCEASAEVTVDIQPVPVISFEVAGEPVSGAIDLCFDQVAVVDVVATEGATAGWDDNGLPSIGLTQSGEYSAFAGTPGCSAVPQTLEVNLLPVPQTEIVATPETLCWEESGVLQLNVSADALVDSIAWPDGTNSLTQAGPGGYEFFMVGDNGCENSETFAYSMLPPIVSGLVDPDPLCDDSIATLSITGNVDNIAWNTGGSGADLTVFPSMGGGPFVANVTLGACSRSDTAHVTWWPTPSVGTLQDSVSRCVLGPGYSFAWPDQSESAVGTWVWTVNGEPATAGYDAFEEGLYTIEVSDNVTGCFDTHETVLNVLPNLALDIDVDVPLICMGDSTSVEVTILSVLDTDPYEIPFSLEWSTEGMSGLTNNAAGGQHFVVATNACGSVEVMAEVEEEYCGCNLWIPNTFTPDGDGLNDGFQIVSSCQWDAFSFRVFNRWGEQVWSTFDQDRPWDGGADDLGEGKHYLPDGVYTYVVRWEYRDRGVFFKDQKVGHVLLVR